MASFMIKDPSEAFVDYWIEPDKMPLDDEFREGGKLYRYAPLMENIYQVMAFEEQTQQWARVAKEVIIPFLKECDDIKDQERRDYIELFKKHHGPGNVREKHIAKAAELVAQLQEDDPVLATLLRKHRPLIICEPYCNRFTYGKATIQYNDGTYKDAAEAAVKAPTVQRPDPKPPGAYRPNKEDLKWRHPRRVPQDDLGMKQSLFHMLQKLRHNFPTEADVFSVEVYKWKDPVYHVKIKESRSFDQIQYDIQTPSWGGYGARAFLKDMHLVFSNARRCYGRESYEGMCASKLEKEMQKLLIGGMGEDGTKVLELYNTIVTEAIAADPASQWAYIHPDDTNDSMDLPAAQPSQQLHLYADMADSRLPPNNVLAPTSSAISADSSPLVDDKDGEDDEAPITANMRRNMRRKAKAIGDNRGEFTAVSDEDSIKKRKQGYHVEELSSSSSHASKRKKTPGNTHMAPSLRLITNTSNNIMASGSQDGGVSAAQEAPVPGDFQLSTLRSPPSNESPNPGEDERIVEELVFGIIDESLSLPSATAHREHQAARDQKHMQLLLFPATPIPEVTEDQAAESNRTLKLRGPVITVAEYEQLHATYETDISSKRDRSDDDSAEEILRVPLKQAKVYSNSAVAPLFDHEEPAAFTQIPQDMTASALREGSPVQPYRLESLYSQSTAAKSLQPHKRNADKMNAVGEDQATLQEKRQRTSEPGTISATNLGFAKNHRPITFYNIFAYRSAQGLGVYTIKCPRKNCKHVFKQHPLQKHRARDHFRQCGSVFADEKEMLQECAQQVVDPNNDKRFTMHWIENNFNGSIVNKKPARPRLDDESCPPTAQARV
ncbi:hypothetical protein N0V93_004554 [Gnomoniopsis smithogilvyi]|uniref:Uncharacterized protein n=1 Tax=Gnomoniopsis smithogilvyi TaxID=1191159 RepID=A0A9W8YTY1_9PEZI|nr:hypothetical protein N0V93_004554 [Gnomoniopsis smithogilvyi]